MLSTIIIFFPINSACKKQLYNTNVLLETITNNDISSINFGLNINDLTSHKLNGCKAFIYGKFHDSALSFMRQAVHSVYWNDRISVLANNVNVTASSISDNELK